MSTTPNSFDAELDKIVIIKSDLKGLKSHVATLKSYPAAKQALKSLYLTHRNAELQWLLEQQIKVTDDIGPHRVISVKLIEDLIKEEHE